MKIIVGIILLLGVGIILLYNKKDRSIENEDASIGKQRFFSLDDGNQDSLILYSTASIEWVDSVRSKFQWSSYNKYDNRMWEYMDKLFDAVVVNSGANDYRELWNKLNRPQKVFWAFLAFNGDTDNGGVYQFFFNKPEFMLAAAEMWKEIGLEKISKDYSEVLKELAGKGEKLSELKSVFNDQSLSWEKRWNSFVEGKKGLKSTEVIEDYYYTEEFKKECHQRVADYIELNMDKFRK